MAFQQGTDTLTCPTCNARHLARWERIPFREEYLLNCIPCGAVLARGKAVKDYVGLAPAS